jgi:Transposase, Mutator family
MSAAKLRNVAGATTLARVALARRTSLDCGRNMRDDTAPRHRSVWAHRYCNSGKRSACEDMPPIAHLRQMERSDISQRCRMCKSCKPLFPGRNSRRYQRELSGSKEDTETVRAFFQDMRARGLGDPILVASDGAPGIIRAIGECFPQLGPAALPGGVVEEVACMSVLCRDQPYHRPPSKQARETVRGAANVLQRTIQRRRSARRAAASRLRLIAAAVR